MTAGPINPGGGGPIPPSLDAANFAQFSTAQLKDVAAGMKAAGSQFSQDQILQDLSNLQTGVQTAFATLTANSPVLPPPGPTIAGLTNVKGAPSGTVKAMAGLINSGAAVGMQKSAGTGNPWMTSNSMVSFQIALQEYMKAVSKLKLLEGTILGPMAIKMQTDTAKAIGDKIMEAANKEAEIARNAAIAAGVIALISVVGAGFSFGSLSANIKAEAAIAKGVKPENLPNAMQKTVFDGQKLANFSAGTTALGKGLEGAVTAGQKGQESVLIMEKANAEKQKVLLETLLSLAQKRGADSSESMSNAKETISQILQAMNSLVSSIETHSLRIK
jgi:hypothetical protein